MIVGCGVALKNVSKNMGWILWVSSSCFHTASFNVFFFFLNHVSSICYLKIITKDSFWKMCSDDMTCVKTKRKSNQMEKKKEKKKNLGR